MSEEQPGRGPEETGPEETGPQETGAQETGAQEPGAEQAHVSPEAAEPPESGEVSHRPGPPPPDPSTRPAGPEWRPPAPEQQWPPPTQRPPVPQGPSPQQPWGPSRGHPPTSYGQPYPQQWPPPVLYPPAQQAQHRPSYPPPQSARTAFPHPEPRPYHLMLRTWSYAWWKPVVGILLTVFGMLVVAPFALLPVLALGVAVEGGPFLTNFEKAATLQTVDPAALLYLNLVLGSMILITWAVIRVVHRMRPRWLASVKPKIRWSFLFACIGLAVVALVAQVLVAQLLPGQQNGSTGKLNTFTASSLAVAVVVILTTPLQAAGEEYVFRGYLLQAVGSLFGNKWIAIVATATLFAAAHGGQNFPLFFDRFTFGFIAGWLVTRTGGLEAGIAMHILNNFLAFGFAIAFGDLTDSLQVSEASWWNIPVTLTQSGVYAVLVLWLARRMHLQTHTQPSESVPLEPPPAVGAPVSYGA